MQHNSRLYRMQVQKIYAGLLFLFVLMRRLSLVQGQPDPPWILSGPTAKNIYVFKIGKPLIVFLLFLLPWCKRNKKSRTTRSRPRVCPANTREDRNVYFKIKNDEEEGFEYTWFSFFLIKKIPDDIGMQAQKSPVGCNTRTTRSRPVPNAFGINAAEPLCSIGRYSL